MTRLLLLLLVMLSMIVPTNAQKDSRQLYERKIESFTKMRNGGISMAFIGAGLSTAGIVMIATLPDGYWNTGDYYYDENDDYGSKEDAKAIFCILSITIGVGLVAGGITMSSIGSRKIKQYQGRLNSLSFDIKSQGFTLTYKF